MFAKAIILFAILSFGTTAYAQHPVKDTFAIDTTIHDYDLLFSELEAFIDSITAPRTYFLFNNGLTIGTFNKPTGENDIETINTYLYTPSVALYHHSGFGVSAEASIMQYANQFNAYQYAVTGSYDWNRNRKFASGISYTHFVTRDDLEFYTSPLQSQLFAYFTYRKWWFKPSVAVSYGWGNRSKYSDREEKIQAIQLAQQGFTRINTRETISDLNFITSVKHDFYWLKVLGKRDYFRFTPQISFSSGTHQFGINQTSNTYATVRGTGIRVLYDTENYSLDNSLYFQPLSLSGFLKAEYNFNNIYINPQLIGDYYFPARQNNFTVGWLVNVGVLF